MYQRMLFDWIVQCSTEKQNWHRCLNFCRTAIQTMIRQIQHCIRVSQNFHNCRKFPWLWRSSLTVEKFLDWESFLSVEKFLDCEKVPWLWKSCLIVERFFDCRKVPCLWKTYFLDYKKIISCKKAVSLLKYL